jgi:hypothetical protein
MPLAVLGMLLAARLMVSVVSRYELHQTSVGRMLRDLENGVAAVADALETLAPVPLSRELRVMLRGEIHARYLQIGRLRRRHPAIREKTRAAEDAISAEGAKATGGVGPIESDAALRRILRALDQLADLIGRGATVQPVPRDVRTIFRRELGERRAEAVSRYHLVEARRRADAGDLPGARAHLKTLMQILRERGPGTGFVHELRAEAQSALSVLGAGQGKALSHDAATPWPQAVSNDAA